MHLQIEDKNLVIFESALWRTTTSLIISENYLLLVDPNYLPIELEFIQNYIDTNLPTHKKYLLFTHSDFDHIVAYGMFSEYISIASEKFVNNPSVEKCLQSIHSFDEEHYILRDYPIVYPEINLVIHTDQQVLSIEEDQYLFVQAPGHNADGLIAYNMSKHILVVGDYLSNIEFPFIYHSVEAYLLVLDKIKKLVAEYPIRFLIAGHGDYTSEKTEIIYRIADARSYIIALEKYVKNETLFDINSLLSLYNFSSAMRRCHEDNVKFLQKSVETARKL